MLSSRPLEKGLTFLVLGLVSVAFAGYQASLETIQDAMRWGFFVGLGAGSLSILAEQMREGLPGRPLTLRLISLLLSPIGFFAFLPLSPSGARAFLVGSAITFCLGIAVQSLVRRRAVPGKADSNQSSASPSSAP